MPLTPQAIDLALSVLEGGGIVAHPTETCYGLACDLTNPSAVARLFALKKRQPDQPVSALFSSLHHAKEYVEWNAKADDLAKKHLPGPLTIILPLRTDAKYQLYPTPPPELSTDHSLGIRISSHPAAQELVERFGKPLSTTSANIHGQPAAYSPQEIVLQFTDNLLNVLLIDGGSLPLRPPSTIIDLTGPSPQEIRRGNTITEV
ncbi:threonylcarbamoyl-AMP synthase, partial [Candidatus Peregrinibacteria bacterium]|nr:threonylcarbamoyl-AMP synthase [Candidatus Peregrinibacteria bacterium]